MGGVKGKVKKPKKPKKPKKRDEGGMIELINSRTLFTKVFSVNARTKNYQVGLNPKHYLDSGSLWADIDLVLQTGASVKFIDKAAYNAQFPDNSTGVFNWFLVDSTIDFQFVGINSVVGVPYLNGTGVEYTNAFGPGIDLVAYAHQRGVRYKAVFRQAPPSPTSDFLIKVQLLTFPNVALEALDPATQVKIEDINPNVNENNRVEYANTTIRIVGGANTSTYLPPMKVQYENPTIISPELNIFASVGFYKQGNNRFFTKTIPAAAFAPNSYPLSVDPSYNLFSAAAGDGTIEATANSTWATVRGDTTGTVDSGTQPGLFTEHFNPGSNYSIRRWFVPFDTSTVPIGETVTAADIIMFLVSAGYSNGDDDGDDFIALIQTTQGSITNLVGGDYDNLTLNSPTEGMTRVDYTSLSGALDQDYTWALNSTALGWINKGVGGETKLGFREGHDVLDSPISNNSANKVRMNSAESANDPELSITTIIPGAPNTLLLLGVGI